MGTGGQGISCWEEGRRGRMQGETAGIGGHLGVWKPGEWKIPRICEGDTKGSSSNVR